MLTKSEGSSKITTKQLADRFIATTLDIPMSEEHLIAFLKKCKFIPEKEQYPEWLTAIKFLDDESLNTSIAENKSIIKKAENEISTAESKLAENMDCKSVLFVNGDDLVRVVFKILEKMLNVSLEFFVDKKKEDVRIHFDDFDFIGEIKGENSNIKSRHITQLDTHYNDYLETLKEKGEEKEVKALLIINPLRKTPLHEREDIHVDQIALAERNGSLIIETEKLLKVYELFIEGNISRDKCIEMLRNETGLLTNEVIRNYCNEFGIRTPTDKNELVAITEDRHD
jgi:hypothetical protein